MNRALFLLLLMTAGLQSAAQIMDDFSDGNFTRDPKWTGDTARFVITGQRLQLAAPAATGVASLATGNMAIFNATWEFSIELQFNPSASNYGRFYMVSDQQDLNGPLNGYFVQIGSTSDDVSVYRQTGTVVIKLIDGLDGRINFNTVNARMRISTDEKSNWKLEVDTSPIGPTGIYVAEGSIQDMTYLKNLYTGFRCAYTSTRADKFFFDDVRCTGQPWPDREPPYVAKVSMRDSITVAMSFSEAMDQLSLTQPTHYDPGVQNAIPVDSGRLVWLKLTSSLKDGEAVTLAVKGLSDLAGNVMRDTVLKVYWLKRHDPLKGDVLINEIMADPSPPVGLPDFEYVELLNRSQHPFNLEGWRFGDATSFVLLPMNILLAGEMVTLIPKAAAGRFTGAVITIDNFPSLNNSGDRLVLQDSTGAPVEEVNYSSSWHTVTGKEVGGWSLERIDPRNACDDGENWASSIDPKGGTPGMVNSILASHPDLKGPKLVNTVVNSFLEVQVDTDERIDYDSFRNVSIKTIPELSIDSFHLAVDGRRIFVKFSDSLHRGIFYRLIITGLRDCPGNFSEAPYNSARFILPFHPEPMDVVINEILFDPHPGGVDFVELFNRSEKYLELKNWTAGNGSSDSISNPRPLPSRLLCPGCFCVLTSDAAALKANYPALPDSAVLEMTLPSLPDDEGSLAMITDENSPMDALRYSRDWHLSLIRSPEGVSLERMSPWLKSQDHNNWRSAGSGWGTPGRVNSCWVDSTRQQVTFKIEPEVVDRASGQDFTMVKFSFPDAGLVAHAEILDYDGYPVKTLANNEPIGAEGFFRWDLDRDDGKILRPGFYVVLTEVFDSRGYRRLFRGRVVLLP